MGLDSIWGIGLEIYFIGNIFIEDWENKVECFFFIDGCYLRVNVLEFLSCRWHDSFQNMFVLHSVCSIHTFCLFRSISSGWELTEICPAYSNYDIILKRPGVLVPENVNLTFLWCLILTADVCRLASALPPQSQATYPNISWSHNAILQISSCRWFRKRNSWKKCLRPTDLQLW